jgi:phosphoesterase RecJ-like protein
MFESVLSFFDRHHSFILTTHDSPDADGIGAQMVISSILKQKGKAVRIINADPLPSSIVFMDSGSSVEVWDAYKHSALLDTSALMILDTSEEYHIGSMRKILKKVKEVFAFDHHELKPRMISGFLDSSATSTVEMTIELTCMLGYTLDPQTATAAYAGIVYDSGFFSYPKTSIRTFNAAIKTLEWGAQPNIIYRQMVENGSYGVILLQKQALSKLEFYADKKIAVMALHKEDFEETGADFEDAEGLVNIPLKAREVEVSVLFKEKPDGQWRCSLRSKGKVNVSKIAQGFGGGGHVTAAGLICQSAAMEKTLKKLLDNIIERLNGV